MRDASDAAMASTLILKRNEPAGAARKAKHKLLILSGNRRGEELTFDRSGLTIGASGDNDVVLDDPTVSRRHCEIRAMADGFRIRDLESTNGTTLHGLRIREAYLQEGAEFQVGGVRLVFCPLAEPGAQPLSPRDSFGRLRGASAAMRRLYYLAETFAPSETAVLIEGETGTGKELLAEALHRHSARRAGPFVVVDCGSLAKGMVESELFGHVKGAYTGAVADRAGAFEAADGGTVFLDEIGELEPELQPRLLRVLERKEVRRVGANAMRQLNVRVIAATNRNLEREVKAGRFREDLYFRLVAVRLELPPLRWRREDIPLIVGQLLEELPAGAALAPAEAEAFRQEFMAAMAGFQNYDWPGNVRELRNLVEMALLGRSGKLDLAACLTMGRVRGPAEAKPGWGVELTAPFKVAKGTLIERFERDYVEALLARHGGNVSQAAREAQIERAYLQRLMKKHALRE